MSNEAAKKLTWEQLKELERGTLLYDEFDEGARFIIVRGPFNLCAYIGIPLDHPLAGFDYDTIPISVHGGLTFADEGDGKYRPKGYYWYGWDYGYCDDGNLEYDMPSLGEGRQWLVEDVINDCWDTIYDFKTLMKLAEKISKADNA